MNFFKKSVAFASVFGFMLLPRARAGELSYGVKMGIGTSFLRLSGEKLSREILGPVVSHNMWNPSFGAALYIEYAFNDHIGLGTEILYSKFDGSETMLLYGMLCNKLIFRPTIGLPAWFVWNWTALIGPDFKKDYFLGRLFVGVHPFWCIAARQQKIDRKQATGEYVKIFPKEAIAFDTNNSRSQRGMIIGTSLELLSGWLLEIKYMDPCNLDTVAIHLSVGYNCAKLWFRRKTK